MEGRQCSLDNFFSRKTIPGRKPRSAEAIAYSQATILEMKHVTRKKTVARLVDRLKVAETEQNWDHAATILEALQEHHISYEILEETKVGRLIQRLRKLKDVPHVTEPARKLYERWHETAVVALTRNETPLAPKKRKLQSTLRSAGELLNCRRQKVEPLGSGVVRFTPTKKPTTKVVELPETPRKMGVLTLKPVD